MATTLPKGIYPIATQDSQSIPMDVIEPIALIVSVAAEDEAEITIPAGYRVATISVDKETFIRFGQAIGSVVDGVINADLLYIPEGSTITVAIPINETDCYVKAASTNVGKVYIQLVQQWSSLGIDTQYVRK